MKRFLKWVLALTVLGLAGLAWDVYQLRALRPPGTLDAFLKSGRPRTSLRLDKTGGRYYWIAPPPKTLLPHPEPPVYVFDLKGNLLDWTPGREPGMLSGAPIRVAGEEANVGASPQR